MQIRVPVRLSVPVAMCLGLLCASDAWGDSALTGPDGAFSDHGIAAPVSELRGIVGVRTAAGRELVVANAYDLGTRGYVLITDLESSETGQVYCPDDVPHRPPYAAIRASTGLFYTAQGGVLLELDPATGRWTFQGTPSVDASAYLAFTESPDGRIWAGSVYGTVLVSYDPRTGVMEDHGRLDPREQYVMDLAADDAGWVYAGIGTARGNIVAYDPETGEKRSLIPEDERRQETAVVYPTIDGAAVGRAAGRTFRLHDGRATEIDPAAAPRRKDVGDVYWSQATALLPSGREIVRYDLANRRISVRDPGATEPRTIEIAYESGGAAITSLGLGPRGTVYGSTAHPMHFLAFDPRAGRLEDKGAIVAIGGGNLCSITRLDDAVFGAQYPHGRLWRYDVDGAWGPEEGNPRWVAEWPDDIARPRAAFAHPDGRTVVIGGYADYGLCGGGLGLYDIASGTSRLLRAEGDLLPGHSPIALAALSDGSLVTGTSVDCPGGGHTSATEAEVVRLDWTTKRVADRVAPVPGDRNVVSLAVGADGRVHGLSGGSTWFVIEPDTWSVVHAQSLAAYGSVPRHALHPAPDGTIVALLSRAILRLDPEILTVEVSARPPAAVTAGGALSSGSIVYASGSRLWSYRQTGGAVFLPFAGRRPDGQR